MDTYPDITITALLGQAAGDAFGAPFEYNPDAFDYATLSWNEERYLDPGVDVRKGRPDPTRLPGLYTDDTQQALALLRCWRIARDPLDAQEIAQRFQATIRMMAREGNGQLYKGVHRGTGRNFREVVRTGRPVDTAGLGAAMRIGPVVTLLPEPEIVGEWVVRVSSATTYNPVALAGAVIYAYACWRLAHPDRPAPALSTQIQGIPSNIWEVCVEAHYLMRDGDEEAMMDFARSTGLSNKSLDVAANGFALTGIPWIIYHGLSAETFGDALMGACSSGGDTDTVGAMVGCMAALRFGRDAIPAWMLDGLHGREHLDDPTTWHPVRSEEALIPRRRAS